MNPVGLKRHSDLAWHPIGTGHRWPGRRSLWNVPPGIHRVRWSRICGNGVRHGSVKPTRRRARPSSGTWLRAYQRPTEDVFKGGCALVSLRHLARPKSHDVRVATLGSTLQWPTAFPCTGHVSSGALEHNEAASSRKVPGNTKHSAGSSAVTREHQSLIYNLSSVR